MDGDEPTPDHGGSKKNLQSQTIPEEPEANESKQ